MALAKLKQQQIIEDSKKIEQALLNKFKRLDPNLTFGGKMKSIQDKLKNPFLIDAIWSVIKIRNSVVHDNDIAITIKEYDLFLSLVDYIFKRL